jgi:hypothetical protein
MHMTTILSSPVGVMNQPSCDLDETEAYSLIVNGFIEPITKELPMEYAVELNRLIQLEMSGSVG